MHRCKCVETHTTNYVVRRVIMKEKLCFILGALGAWISDMLGGWTSAMTTLLVFMCIDYVTGLMVAALGKSTKSQNGGLSSKAGMLGLAKKFMIMLMLLVACRLDMLIGTNYIKDMACIAFILNELISLTENVGMFIPLPSIFRKAIDILKDKSGNDDEDGGESENVHKLK